MAKMIRLRDRNQITLPDEVTSPLGLREDDYLSVHLTETGHILLTPTRLVRVGTPQAEASRREAEEDVREKRYETYRGTTELANALVQRVANRRGGIAALPGRNRAPKRAANRTRRTEPAGQR